MSDPIDKTLGGAYTESKLVFFSISSVYEDWDSEKSSFTDGKLNNQINKFIKDGWTPINMSNTESDILAVLFCR